MPFNGSGQFVPLAPPDYPAVTGATIRASQFNNNLSDVFTGLSNCITRDGQGRPSANIDWAGYNLSNVGDLAVVDDAAIGDDLSVGGDATVAGALTVAGVNIRTALQYNNFKILGTVAGTNTITATASPTLTAYALGQVFTFLPTSYNTGAVTLNIDGLGAKAVILPEGDALDYRNLSSSTYCTVFYDGTSFRLIDGFMRSLSFTFSGASSFVAEGSAVSTTGSFFTIPLPGPSRLLTGPTGITVSSNLDFALNRLASQTTVAVVSITPVVTPVKHILYFGVTGSGLTSGETLRLLVAIGSPSGRITFTDYTW